MVQIHAPLPITKAGDLRISGLLRFGAQTAVIAAAGGIVPATCGGILSKITPVAETL